MSMPDTAADAARWKEMADASTAGSDRERAMLMARVQAGDREAYPTALSRTSSVSVTPYFSPSHAAVATTPLQSATAVVELEAGVSEPAQKPRHWQKIGPPQ
jgi:hypothetical protein